MTPPLRLKEIPFEEWECLLSNPRLWHGIPHAASIGMPAEYETHIHKCFGDLNTLKKGKTILSETVAKKIGLFF